MVEEAEGMKKFLPTLILVLVLAVGFAYAKSQNFFKEQPKEEANKLVTIKAEDIQTLRLGMGEGAEAIELKRSGSAWEMTKPAAYPVEKYSADSLADSFAALSFDEKIGDNLPDLAGFGLDKPVYEIEAVLKDGGSRKLLIGNPLPVAGSSYVKLADSGAIYEMSDQKLQMLHKQPLDLMNKNVFSTQYDKIKSIRMEWKGEKWELVKSEAAKPAHDSAWKIGDKELKPADGASILDSLTFLTTDRTPKNRSDVDYSAPELKLEFVENDNGSETAKSYVGKIDNQLVRIAKTDGTFAYAVTLDQIQQAFDKGKQQ